ncbi:heterokaryon incompatibility protein-domain-containing protein [Thelonectria olida]|uniref:Heterokaryon incompatibility protein-domain-containing protein n=1 Tax=Thelonectria olida TaxID=1576542 RepID=A0A9P8VWQ7_9HYPO|nr:heterokaryon incompatibility protein-domain-containing protein [Thelonectria olida]
MGNKYSNPSREQTDLCRTCKAIPATTFYSSRPPRLGSDHTFGPTRPHKLFGGATAFEQLKQSAASGCPLCSLFADALRLSNYDPDDQLRRQPQNCESGISLLRGQPDRLQITFGTATSHNLDARLLVHVDEFTTKSLEPPSYVVETEADSPANFTLARSWLAECCGHHPECGDSAEFELPRRLLDITVPGTIRLCPTSDLHVKGRANYAALSHCWGAHQPPKTTKSNLQGQMAGFPDTRLPQTFFDAVQATRELGLGYLWIDSLCIVQDDRSDFETECARMNTIYAGALFTLSASDARDATEGLFRSRTMKPVTLTYETDGIEPKLTVIMQPTFSGAWMQGVLGPLQSRAWVLQERHLSPRIIHYTRKSLMWECRTATAAEHAHKMVPKVDTNRHIWPELSSERFLDGGRSKIEPDPRPNSSDLEFYYLHSRWYDVVEQYSRRGLSFPEDKLPAIAGFAAEWKRLKPHDEYLAGLWKSDVFKGLAWFPSSQKHQIRRRLPESDAAWPPASRFKTIPSWSWAAYDGNVAHFGGDWFKDNFYDYNPLKLEFGKPLSTSPCPLQLHAVATTTVGQNPFGHVSGGSITLSSWSMVVALSEEDFSPGYLMPDGDGPKAYRLHADLKYVNDGMVYFDHDPFCLPRIEVLLLQLGMGRTLHGSRACACGLALLKVKAEEGTDEEVYKRVGMFELNDYSFWLPRRRRTVTIV